MEVLQQLYYTLWVRDMTSVIGALAQLVEHLLCKQGVKGSSPLRSTYRVHEEEPSIKWEKTDNERFFTLKRKCKSKVNLRTSETEEFFDTGPSHHYSFGGDSRFDSCVRV